ncbi:BRE1-domain-containing protein [Phanerochaete sordida]|uniref:E3 ubiquitin protein ligase n=1 Tax=Phanerochaete sordida TaxID=48140 RepID=A0A9P3GIP0_9APHY|nr:BRE1-domain-containing protein [Phanerochaete sordida]
MESRKRPRPDDGDVVQAKKRALSVGQDSPVAAVNGDADEPREGDNLEMFRKDAIYRRMKHYARENDRSHARIADLERRRNSTEAALAAIEATWAQLLGTIRSLAKREDLPKVDVGTDDVFDLTLHVTSDQDSSLYIQALRSRMQATEQLVAAFVRVGGEAREQLLHDKEHRRCLSAQTQNAALRAEVSLMQSKLRNAEREKEDAQALLTAAERRWDRLQSKQVAALNLPTRTPHDDIASKEEAGETPKAENGDILQSGEESPKIAIPEPVSSMEPATEAETWEGLAMLYKSKVQGLLEENRRLQSEIVQAQTSARAATEGQIQETSHWKSLLHQSGRLTKIVEDDRKEIAVLQKELETVKASRHTFESDLKALLERTKSELGDVITKREAELARVREQRDQRDAELRERKSRDAAKSQTLHEFKVLADSRMERISSLLSEVARLRSRLAAQANDGDLVKFLFKCTDEERSYLEDLKTRLAAAETRLKAAEDNTDFREVRAELLEARKELARYKSTYGGSLSPDARVLSAQLQQKEIEIENLRLQQEQQEQAETSLYSELDRLSSAWETLDKELKSKVFDLSSMEDKVKQIAAEKAKAEAKYFSVTKEKNACEQENLSLRRTIERQAKSLEKLVEAERFNTDRMHDFDRIVPALENQKSELRTKIEAALGEARQYRARYEDARKRAEELDLSFKEALKDVHKKRQELIKHEELLLKKTKEAEKHTAKLKASSANPASAANVRESELQEEVEKCMSILKCSTCRQNMRNTVITKCMHSFCRNCVNERIQSRQRKCPACNLPFSQGEVQQLFFQ